MTGRKKNGLNMSLNAYRKLLTTDMVYFGLLSTDKTWSPTTNPDTTAMMLMLREDSKSVAMIKHSMDMIWKAVNHLKKVQPIVVGWDEPLYAIVKRI